MTDSPALVVAAVLLVLGSGLTLTRRVFSGDAGHAVSEILAGDRAAGPLAGVPAALKWIGLVGAAVAVAFTPLSRLGWPAVLLLSLAVLGRVPPRLIFERTLDLLPLAAIAGAGVLLAGDVVRFAEVLGRAALVQVALVMVVLTTSLPDLLGGLRALRVPGVLTATVGLTLRYLVVLMDEGSRLGLAFTARAVGPRNLRLARPLGRLVGNLAVRSLERGERIDLAMRARGFDGEWPLLHEPAAPRPRQIAGLLAWLVVIALPAVWPR